MIYTFLIFISIWLIGLDSFTDKWTIIQDYKIISACLVEMTFHDYLIQSISLDFHSHSGHFQFIILEIRYEIFSCRAFLGRPFKSNPFAHEVVRTLYQICMLGMIYG